MVSFENDYSTGAHPRILEALAATNLEPAPGYGGDRFAKARRPTSVRPATRRPTYSSSQAAPRLTLWSSRHCWPGMRA